MARDFAAELLTPTHLPSAAPPPCRLQWKFVGLWGAQQGGGWQKQVGGCVGGGGDRQRGACDWWRWSGGGTRGGLMSRNVQSAD